MKQPAAVPPDAEVSGQAILGTFRAMGLYVRLAEKILAHQGIKEVQPDGWYPLRAYLDAIRVVANEIGENMLFIIGKNVVMLSDWMLNIDSFEAQADAVDIVYHMGHRIGGEPMYNLATGEMKEGIGHLRFHRDGPRSGTFVSDTPYPSDFERGAIVGLLRRWRPMTQAVLDTTQPSRKSGGATCTFLVTW